MFMLTYYSNNNCISIPYSLKFLRTKIFVVCQEKEIFVIKSESSWLFTKFLWIKFSWMPEKPQNP